MTKSRSRLAIPTLDPNLDGGVQSKAKLVYEIADSAGFDPYLICDHIDRSHDVGLRDIALGNSSRNLKWDSIDGMETALIPRHLPALPLNKYLFDNQLWREALYEADICFGVCGSVHCCYPLLDSDKQFGCYVATLLRDERTANRKKGPQSNPVWKRSARWLRDAITTPVLDTIENRIYEAAETIVPVSEYTGTQVVSAHNVDTEKIQHIPYPIETEKFISKTKPNIDNYTIMFAGNLLMPRKNTQLLIHAFSHVKQQLPNARLKLLGTDSYEPLSRLATNLGVRKSVDFEGRVPLEDLPGYYRRADVLAIPSQQEGLAIVGLEAMASGTPVVSTRCGGPEEYIQDGKNGYLVPAGDKKEFADTLIAILEDDEHRQKMGKNAYQYIECNHSKKLVEDYFVQLFKSLSES